jgi:hypothetical protein
VPPYQLGVSSTVGALETVVVHAALLYGAGETVGEQAAQRSSVDGRHGGQHSTERQHENQRKRHRLD